MLVIKRNKRKKEAFNIQKVWDAANKAFLSCGQTLNDALKYRISGYFKALEGDTISVEEIQNSIEKLLMRSKHYDVAKSFVLYRKKKELERSNVEKSLSFIQDYKKANNTANATVDDNSNVSSKNIGVLNAEIHKKENIQISRRMIVDQLKSQYKDFDAKQYLRDLESHILYKHDESTFAGAVAPYCVSISMYPFLLHGLKEIGGLSAKPKNLDSFCGMYINLVFAISAQFAGAVATSEFFLCFDYFARKQWGDDYYKYSEGEDAYRLCVVTKDTTNEIHTIGNQIKQYFQQVVYSINQPAAARGMQAAFVNFSIFDKTFFESMFSNFYFPDGTQAQWESLRWLQQFFMQWFNAERLKCILTFPVISVAMINKDGKFQDDDMFKFVCEQYSKGDSFFTYISDTADSLASCCRLKNKVQTKEFNFTNGNMGIQTGSKSVMTLNLNRITQNWCKITNANKNDLQAFYAPATGFKSYLVPILERVYKYQTAYNELLYDVYNSHLLPTYSAGFISLDKQYLTIGLNGLNEAAEFMGIRCSDNNDYSQFCQHIFSTIKEENLKHKTKRTTFNTECVPAESLAIKNYNWDKQDKYIVPKDRNLYASYIYIPSDNSITIMDKIRMHGDKYIGDTLDGGSAAHLNLDSHLSATQYEFLLNYAAKNGCQYLTFNVPNSECAECGFITKVPITKCLKCGSDKISYYDRVIGYLTKIKNWSNGRQVEQSTRVYENLKTDENTSKI